ncbi:putative endoglucanase-4 [Glarea lozoyensis 74030]|uniref:Putative endoglucanase-4 n=1 Tax=Glarea lozoyensis (strain ATCC 74030 / MF5533) TaxID=1104152 RepID=H0EEL6_GLAL7|nr:putative endoglucanase-4 [Glarea lozoyensis 74030]
MSSFANMKSSALLALAASVAQVSAHGFVQVSSFGGYLVNQYPYAASPPAVIGWTESATDLGFVAPSAFSGGDIICHRDATNAQLSASVAAGGTVTMEWNTWPESHKGPVIDYMAKCAGDCATVDKTTLEFFKIAEKGIVDNTAAPGTWASDELMANNMSWAITIPATLAPGNYVLRHEMIALHSAGSADGAQAYPQCINLEVTGSGTETPAGVVGTALYTPTDPGILVNIYTAGLEYVIPGPALAFGASSGGSTPATPASSSAAAPVATSAAAPAATSASAPVATDAPVAVPTTLVTAIRSSTAAAPVATAAPVEEDDEC